MAVPISLSLSKHHFLPNLKQTQFSFTPKVPNFLFSKRKKTHFSTPIIVSNSSKNLKYGATILSLSGLAFTTLMVGSASGSELAIMGSSFQFNEPSNALSLHTWASHVSSVVEWYKFSLFRKKKDPFSTPIISNSSQNLKYASTILSFSGLAFTTLMVGPDSGSKLAIMGSSFQFNEPSNALSLHTWASHVSSVVEWVTAMALVWQYGEKLGNESWKGLSWAMVPLLGGALCACTWHFFYNSESLEVVVALQAALTVIGNATMCLAAFRIYRSSQKQSKKL